MNRLRGILVATVALSIVVSFGGAYPLTNTLVYDNADGWFTTGNLNEYGDDLDGRLDNGDVIFSGHPAYVIESDDARLVFDRPRVHYFAVTFRGTSLGDQQYRELADTLNSGRVPYVINNDMTRNMLRWNGSGVARQAFLTNYCRVQDADAQRLYDRTNATLYEYVGGATCESERQPSVMP